MEYQISLTESAKKDIDYFEVNEQRIIVAGIISHLKVDAETETRRGNSFDPIQSLRGSSDLIGSELSIRIEEGYNLKVVAVGYKEHNDLFIQGKKVQL